MEEEYSNRVLDLIFQEIKEALARIETQTIKTNGKVRRMEKILIVFGTILATISVIYYPQLLEAIKLFI